MFLTSAASYLFAAASIMILSGGMMLAERQPDWLQPIARLLPLHRVMGVATAITCRSGDPASVWPTFPSISLIRFRRAVTMG